MITEIKENACQQCGEAGSLLRLGRRKGLAVVHGVLCECDIWRCICIDCNEDYEIIWQAWPKW